MQVPALTMSSAASAATPEAAAHRAEADIQQQSQLLKQTCARLAEVGVHDASATVAGCQLRKQLCVRLLGGTGPGGAEVDALELGFHHACRLLPAARPTYLLIGPQPSQRQDVHFRTTAGLALRSSSEFTAFRRTLGIARGSYVAVATCAEPSHLHIIALQQPASALQQPATPLHSAPERIAPSSSEVSAAAGSSVLPPPTPTPASAPAPPAQPPLQLAQPAGTSPMTSPVRLPPPMARPAAASSSPATGRGPPSPAQMSRAWATLVSPAPPVQQGQPQERMLQHWPPPLSSARPHTAAGASGVGATPGLRISQSQQPSTASVAGCPAAQSPARSTSLQLQRASAVAKACVGRWQPPAATSSAPQAEQLAARPAPLAQQQQQQQQDLPGQASQQQLTLTSAQPTSQPQSQPEAAAIASRQPSAAGDPPHRPPAASRLPAAASSGRNCHAAAAPAPPEQAAAKRTQALQSPARRQPTPQQTLSPLPAQVPAAAARTAVAIVPPKEVADALWRLAAGGQQLGGRSLIVQLFACMGSDGRVAEALSLTKQQVAYLLPDVPRGQLPPTLTTVNGTPCSTDAPGGWYVSGFADFRKAAGVQQGALVKVHAISGRLPWLVVTHAPCGPPAQRPPRQPAAAAPPSSPLSPRHSLRRGSEPAGVIQVNTAAGKCWLRRQLRVHLGGGNSSATGGSSPADASADTSAAAAPLLSVPAADVRDLLHPYARCRRYTLVSDSGMEQEVAFGGVGGGGGRGGGDMCSSNDGELASFLQAAGISLGSNVSIAVCNDMQHLHISQLHQSARQPPASTTAAAPADTEHAGGMTVVYGGFNRCQALLPSFRLSGRHSPAACYQQHWYIACRIPVCHAAYMTGRNST